MNQAQALHSAARHFCVREDRVWADRYSELSRKGLDREGNNYSSKALDIFPRYNVLRAIKLAVESIDSDSLSDLEDTRRALLSVGNSAKTSFTNLSYPIAKDAMAAERERFCSYVSGLSSVDLEQIEPLPYRRVLSNDERDGLFSAMKARWGIGRAWYPMTGPQPPRTMAFSASDYEREVSGTKVQSLLRERGIERVVVLREGGQAFLESVDLFAPLYDGTEGYFSSEGLDWIAYASHEGSLTLGGWFLEQVKSIWPKWKEYEWAG